MPTVEGAQPGRSCRSALLLVMDEGQFLDNQPGFDDNELVTMMEAGRDWKVVT